MRELAYVQTIKSLSPIPNADAIEKAEVLGWELVVKKNEFKVGDMCVYVEIDSILPELPAFEFLRSRKFRIKTIKLKNQISQGIAFPLSVISQVDPAVDISQLKIGDDLTEILNIIKYDPEIALDAEDDSDNTQVKRSWLAKKFSYYKWKLFGFRPVKRGEFPSDVPKTDEVRVQKMGSALEIMQGHAVYIGEKCEGTSSTFVYRRHGNWLAKLFNVDGIFQVCSRNRIVWNSQKGGETNHHLKQVADKYYIHRKMKKLNRNLAIQAECIGPKIQGNLYKLPDLEIRVFLIFDIDQQKYLSYNETVLLLSQLELPMVPIVGFGEVKSDIKYYIELSKGYSEINSKILREGIVIRSMTENFSFKSINPEYLLKQE